MWGSLIFLTQILATIIWASAGTVVNITEDIEAGHYDFALKLHRELFKVNGANDHVFSSPANIYAAFAVVLYPSGGQTKRQLLDLMGLSDKHEWTELHTNLANLFVQAQNNAQANMSICEGIFVNKDFTIKEAFKKFAKDVYKSQLANVDFAKGQETLNLINSWVSEHTNGRIKSVANEPYPSDTALIMANALFFHANWLHQFSNYTTTRGDFTAKNGDKLQVDYMIDQDKVQYIEDSVGKFKALGLPYENHEFTMYYVIPTEGSTLENLVENFNADQLRKVKNAPTLKVTYKIPKMKISYSAELRDIVNSLGVIDLFTKPDLRNLADNIRVSSVTHKVEVEVREEGTIGSAVTVFEIETLSLEYPLTKPKIFNVDQPFLFFIHQKSTNLIVFYGTVNKPTYQ